MWEGAKRADARVASGNARLESFSLLYRILLFGRFNKVRSIIRSREEKRLSLVFVAMGMTKEMIRIERALNAKSNS